MKKVLVLFFLIATVYLLIFPRSSFAHFPSTDKNITVIFHVEPDDNPIPGSPATLFFDVQDSQKKFEYSECDCEVTITERGKRIFQKKLEVLKNTKPSIFEESLNFTFPYRDIYHVTLVGKPNFGDAFKPFNTSWDFRVDNEPLEPASQGFSSVELILGGFLGLVAIIFIVFESYLWIQKKHKR